MGTPNGTRASVAGIEKMKAKVGERTDLLMFCGWYDWSHTIIPIAQAIEPATFLNVGHGFGTRLLLEEPSIKHITTLESDERWIDAIPNEDEGRHELIYTSPQGESNWICESDERAWDMALIDGMNGQRAACLMFLANRHKSPIIAVHDAGDVGLEFVRIPDSYSVVYCKPDPEIVKVGSLTALYLHETMKEKALEALEKGPR